MATNDVKAIIQNTRAMLSSKLKRETYKNADLTDVTYYVINKSFIGFLPTEEITSYKVLVLKKRTCEG